MSSNKTRAITIVALFLVLGPFVGAVGLNAFLTLLAVIGELIRGELDNLAKLIVGGMVVGMIYSTLIAYVVGLPSALGVGAFVAWKDQRAGEISFRVAIIASLGFCVLSGLCALLVVAPDGRLPWIGALFVAHLSAALVCAWLAKKCFCGKHSD